VDRLTELETPRLVLRQWRDEDLAPLARWNADSLVMRHMGRGPMSREETETQLERFRRHWVEHGFGIWAVEEKTSGRLVGRIGLQFHRTWADDPELGWLIAPELWGRGLATEGGAACARYAFAGLGLPRIVSICLEENVPSRRVMAKLGFTLLAIRDSEWGPLWVHALLGRANFGPIAHRGIR